MNINDDHEQIKQPKWLLELENRKRKPRLAHEVGAGSPCLKCTKACPGLDLHFWRKICKNCKCSRDEHDVCDDDLPQFELIFGPNSKSRTRLQRLHLNNKQSQNEEMFEWVPPNTTKELAEDYMKALPVERLPIKGSTGAALRKQQLQKQIPLHDIDYQACDELTDNEKIEFQQYLDNLKKCAGQGKVFKFFSPIEFIKAQREAAYENSVPFAAQLPSDPPVQLRTPSSFNRATPITPINCTNSGVKTPSAANFPVLTSRLDSSAIQSDNVNLGRYHRALAKDQYNNDISSSSSVERNVPCESYSIENQKENLSENEKENLTENEKEHLIENEKENSNEKEKSIENQKEHLNGVMGMIENSIPNKDVEFSSDVQTSDRFLGKDLKSREMFKCDDIVGSSLDKNMLQLIREKLHMKYANSEEAKMAQVSNSTDLLSTASSPANLVKDKMKPLKSTTEELKSRPINFTNSPSLLAQLDKINSVGNNISSTQTNNPIFPEYAKSKTVTQNDIPVEELEANMHGLTVQATGKKSCHKCEGQINSGDVVVVAEKAKDAVWHPGCFVCTICQELLADLVYFYHKNQLYCARDFATMLKIPRCFACDELIFVRMYTIAEGHNYHVKHFCCWDCDKPLAGQQYTQDENDRPVCLPCYQQNYAKTCCTCRKFIEANQQGVCVKNVDFHATSECFCCYVCKVNLLNGRMVVKQDRLFCSKECLIKSTKLIA